MEVSPEHAWLRESPDNEGEAPFPPTIPTEPASSASTHNGHYCYIPSMDFLLVHVFTFGLDEEEYWMFKVRCIVHRSGPLTFV